jgi:hypothetical protein
VRCCRPCEWKWRRRIELPAVKSLKEVPSGTPLLDDGGEHWAKLGECRASLRVRLCSGHSMFASDRMFPSGDHLQNSIFVSTHTALSAVGYKSNGGFDGSFWEPI